MAEVTVVYWRDIPAQVLMGRGRKAIKVPLSERFEQAIDRAAMKSGAAETDDYLAEWRKEPVQIEGEGEEAVRAFAEALETEYDKDALMLLINNAGKRAG